MNVWYYVLIKMVIFPLKESIEKPSWRRIAYDFTGKQGLGRKSIRAVDRDPLAARYSQKASRRTTVPIQNKLIEIDTDSSDEEPMERILGSESQVRDGGKVN